MASRIFAVSLVIEAATCFSASNHLHDLSSFFGASSTDAKDKRNEDSSFLLPLGHGALPFSNRVPFGDSPLGIHRSY